MVLVRRNSQPILASYYDPDLELHRRLDREREGPRVHNHCVRS